MTINEKEILRHAAQRADQNFQRCQMSNAALCHPHYHRSAVHHHCWRSHAYLQSLHRPFQAAVLVRELGWNAPSVVVKAAWRETAGQEKRFQVLSDKVFLWTRGVCRQRSAISVYFFWIATWILSKHHKNYATTAVRQQTSRTVSGHVWSWAPVAHCFLFFFDNRSWFASLELQVNTVHTSRATWSDHLKYQELLLFHTIDAILDIYCQTIIKILLRHFKYSVKCCCAAGHSRQKWVGLFYILMQSVLRVPTLLNWTQWYQTDTNIYICTHWYVHNIYSLFQTNLPII